MRSRQPSTRNWLEHWTKFLLLHPAVRDEVRSLWLQQNYCSVIERFVSMPSSQIAPGDSWSFSPAIPVESLPLEEQPRARDVYASVTREVVDDIAGVTDDSWNTFFSNLKVTLSADATANLRRDVAVTRNM